VVWVRDGSAMRMRCEKVRKCEIVLLQWCDAMRILIPFSHRIRISHFFAFSHFFCIFCAFFSHFSQLFGEISTKKVEKVQKCEKSAKSAMQMQNANAMRKQCDAMSFYKKCECECDAKKFSHYHPYYFYFLPQTF
jgi:hypothetical protein